MDNGQNVSDTGPPEPDKYNYHIVIIPAHGPPEAHSFKLKEELIDVLRAQHGRRTCCFVYEGNRWNISLPPRRLLNSNGEIEAELSAEFKHTLPDPSGMMFDDMDVVDEDDEYFKS